MAVPWYDRAIARVGVEQGGENIGTIDSDPKRYFVQHYTGRADPIYE